ncbi:adenine phosphoribosyltransferase [Chloropicon primus]|uniref:adenine phosphoribosyltransferase n=1 Tax=Chloropicon primus TaxID=1764295 RepID=A0A5B8MU17_9CHLO|nr:adenine phosphoribosyltransferase [Chloropicon primus]UPR02368.1 adenine phosphoribosyltransferase [Chloropicon primus]|eukprot:QDZ23155.1 adenine phosphoribosyltransferase [Chloropicon primus]
MAPAPAPAQDPRLSVIRGTIREVPNFPKDGILFQDITTTLLDPVAFGHCIELLYERYRDKGVDVVAGFEARGLIFGAPLSLRLKCAFVPLRKPKKLPGETIGEAYDLEYGSDRIEMHVGHVKEGDRVLLVDDLIATGGTMVAGIKLMKKVKAEIVEAACILELPLLKGKDKLVEHDVSLYTMVEKDVL